MKDHNFLLMKVNSINCRQYGKRSLTAAAKHNRRELMHSDDDPIDDSRSHLNISLLDTPATAEGVVELADRLMDVRFFKPKRPDTCIALEGMFSLREQPETFDMLTYFSECAQWLEKHFDGRLLSADVHLDQAHPHCHVLVLLPLVDGGPSGSSVIGYKHDSMRRVQAFFKEVASRYGLRMPPPPLSGADKKLLSRRVHECLYATNDPATHSVLWAIISNCINRDPRLFAASLGVETQQTTGLTLPQLARSPGKGHSTAAAESKGNRRLQAAWGDRSIGSNEEAEADTTALGVAAILSIDDAPPARVSVASSLSTTPVSPENTGMKEEATRDHQKANPPNPPQAADPIVMPTSPGFTRERDSDLNPADWDRGAGEHIPRKPPPPRNQKAAAEAWVRNAWGHSC